MDDAEHVPSHVLVQYSHGARSHAHTDVDLINQLIGTAAVTYCTQDPAADEHRLTVTGHRSIDPWASSRGWTTETRRPHACQTSTS
jgi:hypothetical protein